MKTLLMLVGLPRSGKSSWAGGVHHPIVCPDSIRLALHGRAFVKESENMVWTIARYMTLALWHSGHEMVILDACNHTRKRRSPWVRLCQENEAEIVYQTFRTDQLKCLARAESSDTQHLKPVIDKMAQEIEWPDPKLEMEFAR